MTSMADGQDVQPAVDVLSIVPVRVVGNVETAKAPVYSSIQTKILTGAEKADQILKQDPNRVRAHIWVMPGYADNNTQGYVRIGTRAQAMATGSLDGLLTAGTEMEITNQAEWWLIPDGTHALTVTILDERNAPS